MDCGLCGRAVCDCYMDLNRERSISTQSIIQSAILISKNPDSQTQGADSPQAATYPYSFTGPDKRPLHLGNHVSST